MANTNQGAILAAVQAETGTDLGWNGDWMALFDLQDIQDGTFDERMLAWINDYLGVEHYSLPSAQQAFAENAGFYNWGSMDSIDVTQFPAWLEAMDATWATAAFGAYPTQNWLNGSEVADASLFSVTRASPPTLNIPDADGVYQSFGEDALGRAGLGVLGNGAVTNTLPRLNPTVSQIIAGSVTDAAGFAGFGNSIYFGDNSESRSVRQATSLAEGVVATISVVVKFDDGGPPVFGNSSPADAANSFTFRLSNIFPDPTTYRVSETASGSGEYIVTATGTTGNLATNTGVTKYNTNQNRPFRVLGFQVFAGPRTFPALVPGSSDAGGGTLAASAITLGYVPPGPFRFQLDVNINRLSPAARLTIATWGADADNAVKLVFDTDNRFKLINRKSGSDAVTLQSGVAGATGVYRVTGNVEASDYALAATGLTGATSSSSETLPTLTHWRLGSDYSNALPLNSYVVSGAVGEAA